MKKQLRPAKGQLALEQTLFTFRRKLLDTMRQEVANLHCPMSQIDAISYIAEQGNPSMREIADYLKITPPSATSMVSTMQKNGLITRVANSKDRRTVRITLTLKAWKLFKSFHKIKFDIIKKMFSRLEKDEQEKFILTIHKLVKE